MVNLDDIRTAAKRLESIVVRTPLISSPALDEMVGGTVFLKAENLQRVGSFKIRGAYNLLSQLTPEQAEYYFLSGFTAKLAGTERGITEPTPTFSACFGKAFLSLHPTRYAEVLNARMQQHGSQAYLVNTGWDGSGERISIKATRTIIDAILDGSLDRAETATLPVFNLRMPTDLPGVDNAILDPRNSYADSSDWDDKAHKLATLFIENFVQYTDTDSGKQLVSAGPAL